MKKNCKKCGEDKDESQFHRCERMKDKLQWWCKQCCHQYSKQAKEKNRSKINSNRKKWEKTTSGRAHQILQQSRKTARQEGVSCTLTKEFIHEKLVRGVCEATGWATRLSNSETYDFFLPSPDRIVSGGDYSEENVRIICWGINNMLGNYGEDRLLEVADAIHARRAGELGNNLSLRW